MAKKKVGAASHTGLSNTRPAPGAKQADDPAQQHPTHPRPPHAERVSRTRKPLPMHAPSCIGNPPNIATEIWVGSLHINTFWSGPRA
jgi:hypothetical protein